MVDVAVKSEASWVCHSQGHFLSEVLLPVHLSDEGNDEEELRQSEVNQTNWGSPVLLEQTGDQGPCVLTLTCSPASSAISRLLVISEARTMEVYSQSGEYCGTGRGLKDQSNHPDRSDRGPFYEKQLILENPSVSCEVKLLSLAGRNSVLVCRVIVGLQTLKPRPLRGVGIDMQQVQSLVDEIGTSLSPGAQNLMDMVQFQQKNQTGSLGGFLPLLMGGGSLSALVPPAAFSYQPQPADFRHPPVSCSQPASLSGQHGAMMSDGSPSGAPPTPQTQDQSKTIRTRVMSLMFQTVDPELKDPERPFVWIFHLTSADLFVMWSLSLSSPVSGEVRGPGHAQLAEMMSHFLNAQGREQASSSGPEFLPMLQSVCGQVTKLRLDDAAAMAEKEEELRNGSWELDSAMERRLEEMERRLKEHVDRRLDAIEQKLEKSLLSVLNQGAMSSPTGSPVSTAPPEQTAPTPAVH
ncbi:ATPase PAAT [Labrus mixtus]|uniref:ATPase PAAT n=1 Tax=Labrus mixtus TaxID=508554 RepID=UPI0029BFCB32|nr:ATPase PAAT [Labrus mixtus]